MNQRFCLSLAGIFLVLSLGGLARGIGAPQVGTAKQTLDPAKQEPRPAKQELRPTASAAGRAALAAAFARPPADFSSAPFWVWNDRLTDETVVKTLRDLAGQHVQQVIVHPRPGLMTPYLSTEWFRLWKVALAEAARLGMKLWIYDENSYPSGFAGGLVPDALPESRGHGLAFREVATPPAWSDEVLAVFAGDGDGYKDVSSQARAGAALPGGKYLVAAIAQARPGPWYGGKFYVDLLHPGVTEKFLSLTLDAYKREIGTEFGKRVPGVFTDEPGLTPAGGLPWTERLPDAFQQRWGYALAPAVAGLAGPSGDWKRVRHNYYQLLLEQFIERWGKPYYEYCRQNGLEFTGHYWDHEWPNTEGVPDNMAMSAWQQRPGIDILMNQYAEDVHAQFGNVRAVKEVASIANQLGRRRTLAEGYGAGGWDLRFEDMKRIGDWMYVLGINTLNEHLSYVSLRGARKRDHPQSFSYHEPWWTSYHASADYFARLSVALSAGQQVNEILVLEPTTTAWMYNAATIERQAAGDKAARVSPLDALGKSFQDLLVSLERAQVEYDLGSEDVLARHASVEGTALRVGERRYTTVVLPPLTENLNGPTVTLLETFLKAGGTVLAAGDPPDRVDGATSGRGTALAGRPGWRRAAPADIVVALAAHPGSRFSITRTAADRGTLFHHRRVVGDDQLLFLANTSLDARSSGTFEAAAGGVEEWDPATGRIRPYPFEAVAEASAGAAPRIRVRFDVPEAGSLLLRLTGARQRPFETPQRLFTVIGAEGAPVMRRIEPNVLVLDYMDVRAGGESRERMYFYQASQFAFQKNGVDRNPWDNAVQFRDELLRRTFPAGSGVEATYHFTIKDRVPARLSVVLERPDLYTITCNGKRVTPAAATARDGSWWLDRAFGRIDIRTAARVGENEVRLVASPFTLQHELEPAYLLGDFALEPAGSGFVVAPERGLRLGAWNDQGQPFYAAGVAYSERFVVGGPRGRYRVQLGRWLGSVARVRVNGRSAGEILSAPWDLDVTSLLHPGTNTIEVTVVGTLKNTLGPHHGKPALGSAWPSMFQKGPTPGPPAGIEYSTVGYGLFTPFTLVRVVTK